MAPKPHEILKENLSSWWSAPETTNFVFKLHHQVSVLLIALFLVSPSVLLFNENVVTCVGPKGDVEEPNMSKFAYYLSTFTVQEDPLSKHGDSLSIKSFPGHGDSQSIKTVRHTYYIWVPILLVYQLAVFKVTHHLWKTTGGRDLLMIQDEKNKKEDEPSKKKFFLSLKRYIANRMKNGLNSLWLLQLLRLELINVSVCLHQWWSVDLILNRRFLQLGLNPSALALEELFPLLTKFTFRSYGPTGTIQLKDYQCILTMNAVYKVMFLFYWYWLATLTAITTVTLIYHILLAILYKTQMFRQTWIMIAPLKNASKAWMLTLPFCDWMFLQYLRYVVDIFEFERIVYYLIKKAAHPKDFQCTPSDSEEDQERKKEKQEDEIKIRPEDDQLLAQLMHPVPLRRRNVDRDPSDSSQSTEIYGSLFMRRLMYPVLMLEYHKIQDPATGVVILEQAQEKINEIREITDYAEDGSGGTDYQSGTEDQNDAAHEDKNNDGSPSLDAKEPSVFKFS